MAIRCEALKSSVRALALACTCLCSLASVAVAHEVRGSAVYLDIGQNSIASELHLPISQLRLALQLSAAELSDDKALAASGPVRDYVRAHVWAQNPSGAKMPLVIHSASVQQNADGGELIINAVFTPNVFSNARLFDLHYDAILHRVVTHNAYVFIRRDVLRGLLGDKPELLGMLHWQRKQLRVDRQGGSLWQGLRATFQLGEQHIAEGTDHVLFLLMLLLPAPLLVLGRRWTTTKSVKESALTVVKLVTAFTLGHSLTLVVGAVRGPILPAQLVEALIAGSILLSALHAFRPIFAGGEAFIAAGFGLVHGLAFASSLRAFGFDSSSLVLALLGFNLGIESMQLAIVLLVMPWLVLAARHTSYTWLRLFGAACGVTAALGWIAERTFDSGLPVSAWIDRIATKAPVALAVLALYAVAISGNAALSLRRRRSVNDSPLDAAH